MEWFPGRITSRSWALPASSIWKNDNEALRKGCGIGSCQKWRGRDAQITERSIMRNRDLLSIRVSHCLVQAAQRQRLRSPFQDSESISSPTFCQSKRLSKSIYRAVIKLDYWLWILYTCERLHHYSTIPFRCGDETIFPHRKTLSWEPLLTTKLYYLIFSLIRKIK